MTEYKVCHKCKKKSDGNYYCPKCRKKISADLHGRVNRAISGKK